MVIVSITSSSVGIQIGLVRASPKCRRGSIHTSSSDKIIHINSLVVVASKEAQAPINVVQLMAARLSHSSVDTHRDTRGKDRGKALAAHSTINNHIPRRHSVNTRDNGWISILLPYKQDHSQSLTQQLILPWPQHPLLPHPRPHPRRPFLALPSRSN